MKIDSPILSLELDIKCLEDEIKNYHPPIENFEKELDVKKQMLKEFKLALNILKFWNELNN